MGEMFSIRPWPSIFRVLPSSLGLYQRTDPGLRWKWQQVIQYNSIVVRHSVAVSILAVSWIFSGGKNVDDGWVGAGAALHRGCVCTLLRDAPGLNQGHRIFLRGKKSRCCRVQTIRKFSEWPDILHFYSNLKRRKTFRIIFQALLGLRS